MGDEVELGVEAAMQKLVTIHLTSNVLHKPMKPGQVEEHLEQYLADGWVIETVTALGGCASESGAQGWVVAVLKKESVEDQIPY